MKKVSFWLIIILIFSWLSLVIDMPEARASTTVTVRPTSDIYLNMTPSAGTDGYSMVDEAVADDAGTTLTRVAMGVNYACLVNAPNIPDGATDIVLILGIRASGGTFELDVSFGGGSHIIYGDQPVFTDWALSEQTLTTNPWDSDNPWTVANINTLDSLSIYNFASGAVTQIYAKVTYTPAGGDGDGDGSTGDVLLTGTVLEYITLSIGSGSTISFGNITPGTPKCGDFDTEANITTNSSGGYTLAVSDTSDTNSAMVHADGSTYIPDMGTGTMATPVVWVTGTHLGVGFNLYSGTQKEASWGTGTTACDTAYNKWAAVPASATTGHTVTGYNVSADTSYWGWRVDVANSQKTGIYSGNVLFTSAPVLN